LPRPDLFLESGLVYIVTTSVVRGKYIADTSGIIWRTTSVTHLLSFLLHKHCSNVCFNCSSSCFSLLSSLLFSILLLPALNVLAISVKKINPKSFQRTIRSVQTGLRIRVLNTFGWTSCNNDRCDNQQRLLKTTNSSFTS